MDSPHAQRKALVLMLVLVLGITTFERANTIAQFLDNERNTASVFNPIADFLGISVSGENVDTDSSYTSPNAHASNSTEAVQNGGDAGFGLIPLNSPYPGSVPSSYRSGDTVQRGEAAATPKPIRGNAPMLFCLPDIVDGEEEAIVMWACRDGAYKATGSNFETEDETIGSVRVQPAVDTIYTLTCINNLPNTERTAAECTIAVAKPALAIIATPGRTSRGGMVTLAWKTKDTNSCVVTSNGHPAFERIGIEGEALLPTIVQNTIVTLTCETVTGIVEERSVTVRVQ
jgi:hypothetical protein